MCCCLQTTSLFPLPSKPLALKKPRCRISLPSWDVAFRHETIFLFQSLSICVQCHNAIAHRSTFPDGCKTSDDAWFFIVEPNNTLTMSCIGFQVTFSTLSMFRIECISVVHLWSVAYPNICMQSGNKKETTLSQSIKPQKCWCVNVLHQITFLFTKMHRSIGISDHEAATHCHCVMSH